MILLKKNIKYIFSIYMACIFYMYARVPNGNWDSHRGLGNIILDNLDHLFVFFILGALANLTSERHLFFNSYVKISIIISLLIEFIHYILPYRGFEIVDFVFNIIGCLLGILSFYYLRKFYGKVIN